MKAKEIEALYAFPVPSAAYAPGMTLLDYFAGQALISTILKEVYSSEDTFVDAHEVWAKQSYVMAEAMMKERCTA